MEFQSTRRSRRHRNPQGQEENKKPFFSKSANPDIQTKEDKPFFQPKLTVGRPGDQYEKEADSMAETVVNHSGSPAVVQEKAEGIQKMDTSKMEEDRMIQEKSLQMQAEEEEEPVQMQEQEEEEPLQMQEEEEEEVQMKAEPGSQTTASARLSGRIEGSSGKGKPMAEKTRGEMEQAFGVNFTGVNIHTGANAVQMNRELGAQAFTHGKDVYFNAGKYRPESADGKRLLAHELTHVVQQGGGQGKVQRSCPQGPQKKVTRDNCGERGPLNEKKYIQLLDVDLKSQTVKAVWTNGKVDAWECSPNPKSTPVGNDTVGVKCGVNHTNHKKAGMAYFTAFKKTGYVIGFHNSQPVGTGIYSHGCVRVRCGIAKIINENSWSGKTEIQVK